MLFIYVNVYSGLIKDLSINQNGQDLGFIHIVVITGPCNSVLCATVRVKLQ